MKVEWKSAVAMFGELCATTFGVMWMHLLPVDSWVSQHQVKEGKGLIKCLSVVCLSVTVVQIQSSIILIHISH